MAWKTSPGFRPHVWHQDHITWTGLHTVYVDLDPLTSESQINNGQDIVSQNLVYGGWSIMVWGCFAASGPGQLAVIAGKMNSQVYQDILQEYVCSTEAG